MRRCRSSSLVDSYEVLSILFAIIASVNNVDCSYPVLYIAPDYESTVIENMDTGELFPGHAAFHLFVCASENMQRIRLPCDNNLTARTNATRLELMMSWVDEQMNFVSIDDETMIRVFANPDVDLSNLVQEVTVQRKSPRHILIDFLPENMEGVPFLLQATSRNKTANLTVLVDHTHPTVSITRLPFEKTRNNDYMLVNIQPSEPVVMRSAFDHLNCAPGNFESSIALNYTVDVLLNYSRQCSSSISKFTSIEDAIEVQGGENKKWQVVGSRLFLRIDFNISEQQDIRIQLKRREMVDLSGNVNEDEVSLTYSHRPGRPMTQRHERIVHRGEPLGQKEKESKLGLIIGYIVSISTGGTVAACSASSAVNQGGGNTIPFFLLNLVQKLYLSGHIAVAQMPEDYAKFADQLTWAMFDFPSPFEHLVPRSDDSQEDMGRKEYLKTMEGAYILLSRVFFWVPLLLLFLLLMHSSIIGLCIWQRLRIPYLLTFPRLEIAFCYWGMPAITVACAGLLRGKRWDALVGTWLLVMLPGGMIVWNLSLMWKFFYSKEPKDRCANFIMDTSVMPQRTVVQLKNEWQRNRMMKKSEKAEPAVFFLNGAFDHHANGRDEKIVYINEAEYISQATDDLYLSGGNLQYDANARSRPVFPAAISGEENTSSGEIRPLSPLEHEPMDPPSWQSSMNSHASEPSTSTGLNNRLLQNLYHGWELLGAHPSPSAELVSSGQSHWNEVNEAAEFRPLPEVSEGSSINNIEFFTNGAELPSVAKVEMKTLTDYLRESGPHNIFSHQSRRKAPRRMKYGVSDRFQRETSNNIAAIATHRPLLETSLSLVQAFHASPTYEDFPDLRLSDGLKGTVSRTRQEILEALQQRNPERQETNVEERLRLPPAKPEWATQWSMKCSAIPESAWGSQLWREDRLEKNVTTTPSHPRDSTERRSIGERIDEHERRRLSRISEHSSDQSSSNLPVLLHATERTKSRKSAIVAIKPYRTLETRKTKSRITTNYQFIDDQLGITVLVPDPFYETAARLKYINKECLMDMGLDHLILTESESSDEDRGEVEYQELVKNTTAKRPRISAWTVIRDLFDMGTFSLVMGSPQLTGKWRTSPYHQPLFIVRYGYLFEDYRGLPVLLREPTYEIRNGKMDRGKVVPLHIRPLFSWKGVTIPGTTFKIPGFSIFRHHLQILTRFLQLMKILLLGILVAGVGNAQDCLAQIIFLFFAVLLLMIVLRVARPFHSRLEMAISLSEEVSDVIFLALATLLLLGPTLDEDFGYQIGMGMLCVQLCSFAAILCNRLVLSFRSFGLMYQRRKARKVAKLTRLFRRYLAKNEYFLQRKFFDRWMVKVLKRGLYYRTPSREELPVKYYVHQEIRQFKASLLWLHTESHLIWIDLRNKIMLKSSLFKK